MSEIKSLTCSRARTLLEPYADGELTRDDPRLATSVREQLAGCADCRRQHEQAISLPFRLRALTSPRPPDSLVVGVMRSIAPLPGNFGSHHDVLLAMFILWYLSGLDGLTTVASGIFGDLQGLVGWGSGSGPLPTIPRVDVLLLLALIALTAIAAYHLSILVRLAPGGLAGRRPAGE